MDLKVSESAIRDLWNGKQGPNLPYDTIKLRMEKGRLHVDFDNEGKTMLTFALPHGWEDGADFSIGGVNGTVKVTLAPA